MPRLKATEGRKGFVRLAVVSYSPSCGRFGEIDAGAQASGDITFPVKSREK